MSRAMSKSELAREYGVHPGTLVRWINNNPKLLVKLKKSGYVKTQKLFTPQQVRIINDFFSA